MYFEDIATYARQDQQYGGERPERLTGVRVSHGFFRLFGFEPMLGRAFTREEEANSGLTDVVIISYNLWRRLLGGDPHVIGRTIRLTDYPFRIVGVMPAAFEHVGGGYRLPRGEAVDVWLPFNMLGNPKGVPRAFHYCNTVGRRHGHPAALVLRPRETQAGCADRLRVLMSSTSSVTYVSIGTASHVRCQAPHRSVWDWSRSLNNS